MRLLFCVYLAVLFLMPGIAQATDNDFDKVCQYFEDLSQEPLVEKMSYLERNEFIVQRIKENLPQWSNARASWEAISSAVSEQRYELFKTGAESVIHRSWNCSAMEKLAPRTGVFE